MKAGSAFEKAVNQIYKALSPNSTVLLNDHIMGIESGVMREIDISVRTKISGTEILMIIQCKDHNKRLNVTFVDELWGVMRDVIAQKGILIAKKGFTKAAIETAKKRGIELCMIHDAETKEWKLNLDIPILVEIIRPTFSYSLEVQLDAGDTINTKPTEFMINDMNIFSMFVSDWNEQRLNSIEGTYNYSIELIEPFIRLINGIKKPIQKYTFSYTITKEYKFGYVRDLPTAKAVNQIIPNTFTLLFKEEDIFFALESFTPIYDPKQYTNLKHIGILAFPTFHQGNNNIQMSASFHPQ